MGEGECVYVWDGGGGGEGGWREGGLEGASTGGYHTLWLKHRHDKLQKVSNRG